MIYSQPLDLMIKTQCSFSTVCVVFSLSGTSNDLKSGQLQQATNTRETTLSSPGSCFLLCVFHLVFERLVFLSSVSLCLSVTLCVLVCSNHPVVSGLAVSSV